MTPSPISWLLALGAGFGVWAAGFVAVYATLSVGCAAATTPPSVLRPLLIALALATISASALIARRLGRMRKDTSEGSAPRAFLRSAAGHAALTASAAAAFTFSGLALLPTCA